MAIFSARVDVVAHAPPMEFGRVDVVIGLSVFAVAAHSPIVRAGETAPSGRKEFVGVFLRRGRFFNTEDREDAEKREGEAASTKRGA